MYNHIEIKGCSFEMEDLQVSFGVIYKNGHVTKDLVFYTKNKLIKCENTNIQKDLFRVLKDFLRSFETAYCLKQNFFFHFYGIQKNNLVLAEKIRREFRASLSTLARYKIPLIMMVNLFLDF